MQKINKKYLLIAAAVLVIAAVVLILVLTNKGPGKDNTGAGSDAVVAEIKGVADISVMAGAEINLLEGVTAVDSEGKDTGAAITVTSKPAVAVTDGKAVFEAPGQYELTFVVGDVKEYCTLTVTEKAAEATLFMDMDFEDAETDSHGWTASIAEGAEALVKVMQEFTEEKQGFVPKIVLICPPEIGPGIETSPFRFSFTESAIERSKALPEKYRKVAEKHGLIFVNAAEHIAPSEADSLHLMPEAHRALAEVLADVVREHMEEVLGE